MLYKNKMKNKKYRSIKFYRYFLLISAMVYFFFAMIFYYSRTIQDPMPIEQRLLTGFIFFGLYILTQLSHCFEERIDRIAYFSAIFVIVQLIYLSYVQGFEFEVSINILLILAIINLIFKGDRLALYTNIILALLLGVALYFTDNPQHSLFSFFVGYLVIAGLTYYISNQNYKTAQVLQASEQRYRTIFNTAPFGILLEDKEGTILEVNKTLCEISGYNKKELEGAKITDNLVASDQFEISKQHIKEVLEGKELEFDTISITKNNEKIYTHIKESPIILPGGEQGILSMQIDITERKKQEEIIKQQRNIIEQLHSTALKFMELESETEVLEMTIEAAHDLLDFEFCNIRFLKNDKLVGKVSSSEVLKPISKNEGIAGKAFREGKSIIIDNFDDFPNLESENKNYKSGMSIPIKNLGVFQAISKEKAAFSSEDLKLAELLISHTASSLERIYAEEEIKYKTFHDKLTGLYNRRFFEEELERLDTNRQLPLSIIMADINGLKKINDTLGHKKGDELLVKTANILKKVIRDEDILARWGGDEYVIVLPKTSNEETKKVIKRIHEKTSETKGDQLTVSLGIGSAIKNTKEQDITKILKQADKVMYKDKSSHRK
ncbi:diguanylate cyclase domain-containing protein [Halanaerobium saccharolyticum]|uniref:diguanylate cyclase domain-containing protein n=1 Tax=Halanaerobium saccharolyticum TaxID=43595 RepID=UPI001415304F|nr:diguanylate cyclase [Halanaerobium saccharolyticum]